jgi:hypothetical protein
MTEQPTIQAAMHVLANRVCIMIIQAEYGSTAQLPRSITRVAPLLAPLSINFRPIEKDKEPS